MSFEKKRLRKQANKAKRRELAKAIEQNGHHQDEKKKKKSKKKKSKS
jgi:hypothetical protein